MNWKAFVWVGGILILLLALATVGILHLLGNASITISTPTLTLHPEAWILVAFPLVGVGVYLLFRRYRHP